MTVANASGDILVIGIDGLRGTARRPTAAGAAAGTTDVHLADGRRVVVPTHLLRSRPDGAYDLPLGPSDLAALAAPAPAAVEPVVMPLAAEQLAIYKRRVETGKVRVTKSVQTHEEVVDLPMIREEVTVERVVVERFVTEPPPVRREGDTIIVPVLEEVLVVEKRLMLREEVRLTTHRTETYEPQTVTLRKEVARVDRVEPD